MSTYYTTKSKTTDGQQWLDIYKHSTDECVASIWLEKGKTEYQCIKECLEELEDPMYNWSVRNPKTEFKHFPFALAVQWLHRHHKDSKTSK